MITTIRCDTVERLKSVIEREGSVVDLVIIDCGPSVGEAMATALGLAAVVFAVDTATVDARAGRQALQRACKSSKVVVVGNRLPRLGVSFERKDYDVVVEEFGGDDLLDRLVRGDSMPWGWLSADLLEQVPENVRVVTVGAQKGGVGKSSVAWLLARQAAYKGWSVIIVDWDEQGGSVSRAREYEVLRRSPRGQRAV